MLRTRAPLFEVLLLHIVRLACIRPAASVHPEPGSNSPLYMYFVYLTIGFQVRLETYVCPGPFFLDVSKHSKGGLLSILHPFKELLTSSSTPLFI